LKVLLNLLILNLVTKPTKTSKKSLGVAWIASTKLQEKEELLISLP
jgi:hypothetical protein